MELEAQQGYQNKAVVGGIRQFATFWVGQAREEVVDEQDAVLIEQIAEVLADYGSLSGPEARQKTLDGLFEQLNKREIRVAELQPEKAETAVSAPLPQKQARPSQPQNQQTKQEPQQDEFASSAEPQPEPKPKRYPVPPLIGTAHV